MTTAHETGTKSSRFKVFSLTVLVGLGTPFVLKYVGALEPTWLSVTGIVVLFLLVAEVFFFQLDVFGLGLSHHDALRRVTDPRKD
ncbi:MAG: hypothetical protein SH850_00035 [Planctomycetaceae bacterium]|nr:hypothetical protein [Planctomycetaceae bacterium]